jgi:hemerythrin-like domain-containing protein
MGSAGNTSKPYDLISLIESEQDIILEKLTELEKYAWRMEQSGVSEPIYEKVKSLHEYIFNDISRYFMLEEDLLFPELEKVMPRHSSSAAMKEEHSRILKICGAIGEMLGRKNEMEKLKDDLQAELISLVDILQRHIHKKNHVLYHEVQTMLPPEIQQIIYSKMLKKIKLAD